ncbi:hypothetical protein AF54_00857 [Serratia marcescens BIDMC 81]|nr:hypothetical protein AF54_00857 [Serratia marcescens BIDMC 81]
MPPYHFALTDDVKLNNVCSVWHGEEDATGRLRHQV